MKEYTDYEIERIYYMLVKPHLMDKMRRMNVNLTIPIIRKKLKIGRFSIGSMDLILPILLNQNIFCFLLDIWEDNEKNFQKFMSKTF